MPVGYLRAKPKVDIQFEKDSYRPGDELRVRLTVHTDRPGTSVRRAVVDLVLENRYTHTAVVSVVDTRAARGGIGGAYGGGGTRPPPTASSNQRVTQQRVDRNIIGQERLFTDGVIRHRTEMFDLTFEIKPPPAVRTTQRNRSYMISVHFDLPRMRDVEIHRRVPVEF